MAGGLGLVAVEQEGHCLCQTGPWTPRLNSMEKDVTGKGCSQEGVV